MRPVVSSLLILTLAGVAAPASSELPASPPTTSSPVAGSAAALAAPDDQPAARPRRGLGQRAKQQAISAREVGLSFADRLIEKAPDIVAGLVVFALFWLFAGASDRVLRNLFARAQTDPALAQLALPLTRLAVLGLGALVAIEQMGFNVGSLLAGVGVAGLAVGLAAQETLANLLAGIALLWDRPFRLGNSVTIAGTSGTVTEIGLRSTRLRTLEQLEVTIPNKEVAQQQIFNHSRYPQVRVNVPFRIAHGQSIERVRQLLLAAVAAEPDVLEKPAPQVVVTALEAAGVALELRLWLTNPAPPSATLFHFLEMAEELLGREGVEMPNPAGALQTAQAPRSAGAPPLPG